MSGTRTRYRGDGVVEREMLMDYLAEEFGERWFLSNEVEHPFWDWGRIRTLRVHGLIATRPAIRGGRMFEYRVVNP